MVADNPVDFTVEHEEGHFLGALDEGGKFVADFGHSSGHHMMNPDDVPNGIIPAKNGHRVQQGLCGETLKPHSSKKSRPTRRRMAECAAKGYCAPMGNALAILLNHVVLPSVAVLPESASAI